MYGLFCWWWLRSPGNNQNNAANVNNDGGINENGNNVNNSNNAVRPALLSSSLKRLRKHATPVPRAKESDSFSIFSGKYMSAAEATLFALHSYGRKMIVHSYLPALPTRFNTMTDYEKIYDFQSLYKAHTVARKGKRNTREVIEFEMNLGKKFGNTFG